MNRLAHETSPYLRQHADNPVDWWPWSPEAFAAARATDRPVLVSVGYSSCHWCHVMAHESFEDPDTAAIMNDLFVNVKVDREERPDVDAVYMDAVQGLTGHGGWPMTVFVTPDGEPFFGGTYFPKVARQGMPSFVEVLREVRAAWDERRSELLQQAARITASLQRSTSTVERAAELPGLDVLEQASAVLRRQYDAAWGGFGRAPKFPQTMSLDALLRLYVRSGDDDVLHLVTNSLDAMASGGIYDHLGGGFARYSVDAQWIVPHFEKMLYDNALLVRVYLHAWQLTRKARYLQVLDETIGYVLRDLRHPDGGFYSAEDADSEGEEGKYYVWTPDQIRSVLGDDVGEFLAWYGVTEEGNFEGRNILYRPVRGDLLRPAGVELNRHRLLAAREMRVRPGLDDKVLTEWNALMLASLAEAASATGNHRWREAARRNGDFLVRHLRRDDGRWLRSWQAGDGDRPAQARHLACAADHAALVDAFTRLGEATGEARWLPLAVATAESMIELFWDHDQGGLFMTGHDAEQLITRPKDITDNAVPSANSAAAFALFRLAALTGRTDFTTIAEEIVRRYGPLAGEHPTALGHLLSAVDLSVGPMAEVVVPGDVPELVDTVKARFLPRTVLAWGEPYDSPLWAGRDAGFAYVCQGFTCRLPTSDPGELLAQLDLLPAPPR